MTQTLKIVIPMAGWGTRMRPHTWSKPKPLVSVAGKASLDHLMDIFQTLPGSFDVEYIFIVGPYLGETQIPAYIAEHYPKIKAHYVLQAEMKGQSHALYLTREHLNGPMIMIFSDTFIETDFSFLAEEKSDVVAWVKAVPDPRRFGVAVADEDGRVTHLVEKPDSMENNLAVVGCYYFKEGANLTAAIEEQMRRDVMLKNEYFLADAINIMLENGASARAQSVDVWLDTGTIDATLETNAIMLKSLQVGKLESLKVEGENVEIIPPVFVHPSAKVSNATIGPNVSIGADCEISESQIEDSIVEAGTRIHDSVLTHSLIGKQANVEGCGEGEAPSSLNIGDNSVVRKQ